MSLTTRLFLRAASACLLAVTAGCAAVTPPPMLAPMEAVSRGGPGSVSLTAAGFGNDNRFLSPAVGGLAAVSVQLDDATEVEGSGGLMTQADAVTSGAWDAATIGFGRLGVRHRLTAGDTLFLRAGAGGGYVDVGDADATADVGATIGRTFSRRVRVYAGATTALSFNVRGEGTFAPVVWTGAQLGAAVRVVSALQLGVEGTALGGLRLGESATSSAFSLIASLRYTFPSAR